MSSAATAGTVTDPAISPTGSSVRKKDRHRAVPLCQEFRQFTVPTNIEVRASSKTNELVVDGSPIVYDTQYSVRDMFGEFLEDIAPGSLSDALTRGVDCRLLLNHDGIALARSTSGTLELEDTKTSLNFKATMDARMQAANDFAIAVERGDMNEMSVGMVVGRDEWGEENRGTAEEPDYVETRHITRLDDLLDVSGVTYAASPTTTIDIAKRMVAAMPAESLARLRRLEVALRSGEAKPEDMLAALVALRGGVSPTFAEAQAAGAVGRPGAAQRAAEALATVLDEAEVEGRAEDAEPEERSCDCDGDCTCGVEEREAEAGEEVGQPAFHLELELRRRRVRRGR